MRKRDLVRPDGILVLVLFRFGEVVDWRTCDMIACVDDELTNDERRTNDRCRVEFLSKTTPSPSLLRTRPGSIRLSVGLSLSNVERRGRMFLSEPCSMLGTFGSGRGEVAQRTDKRQYVFVVCSSKQGTDVS